MFSTLVRIEYGEYGIFFCFIADNSNAIEPHTFGDAIDVPFINWLFFNAQFGTEVIAPPGPQIETPKSPWGLLKKNTNDSLVFENNSSYVGPLEDQLYAKPGSFCIIEYSAIIISGET